MIIRTKGSEYPCFRAERHRENIHLFDEGGTCFTVLMAPVIREIQDGEITVIEGADPGPEERIAELEAALELLLSGVTE